MPITEDEEGLTSNRDFALVSGSVECYKVTGYIKQDMLATINTNFASVSLLTWKAGDDLHHTSGDLCNCDFQPEGLERDSDHVGQGEGGESQHRSEDGGHPGGDQGRGDSLRSHNFRHGARDLDSGHGRTRDNFGLEDC